MKYEVPKKIQKKREEISFYILDNRLEFLWFLHEKGVALTNIQTKLLVQYEYIKEEKTERFEKKKEINFMKGLNRDYDVKTKLEQEVDSHVDVIKEKDDTTPHDNVLGEIDYAVKIDKAIYKGRKKEISASEWMPARGNILNYTNEFVDWIDSINKGFGNKVTLSYLQKSQHLSAVIL